MKSLFYITFIKCILTLPYKCVSNPILSPYSFANKLPQNAIFAAEDLILKDIALMLIPFNKIFNENVTYRHWNSLALPIMDSETKNKVINETLSRIPIKEKLLFVWDAAERITFQRLLQELELKISDLGRKLTITPRYVFSSMAPKIDINDCNNRFLSDSRLIKALFVLIQRSFMHNDYARVYKNAFEALLLYKEMEKSLFTSSVL